MQSRACPSNPDRAAGLSLVEVIVAMALMAGVLLSIAGLFSIGERQIKCGRSTSQAVAIGGQILEEINGWAFEQAWLRLEPSGAFASTGHTADTSTNDSASCARWRAVLNDRLGPTASAAIRIDALAGSGAVPNLGADPRNVRITVTVTWSEMARARRVVLATVRM